MHSARRPGLNRSTAAERTQRPYIPENGLNNDTQRRPYWKHLCRKPFRNTLWSHISPLVLESCSWFRPWLPGPGTFALLHSSPPCQFHWKVTWLPGCPRCCCEIFIPAGPMAEAWHLKALPTTVWDEHQGGFGAVQLWTFRCKSMV